jgi:hypothetical protein
MTFAFWALNAVGLTFAGVSVYVALNAQEIHKRECWMVDGGCCWHCLAVVSSAGSSVSPAEARAERASWPEPPLVYRRSIAPLYRAAESTPSPADRTNSNSKSNREKSED